MAGPIDQIRFLRVDLDANVRGRWWRWVSVPLQPGIMSIVGYRVSRAAWLALGAPYRALHTLLAPLRMVLRPFGGGLEIHYLADIGPGLRVLHPTLGAVVSGHAVVGRNLILTGGNCIGGRPGTSSGNLIVGDDVELGANAVILGPSVIGSRVRVGAGAVVIGDAPAGSTMVGVPARPVSH